MIDREAFSRIESRLLAIRRLKPIELLGVDNSFSRFDNPVGIFVPAKLPATKEKLLAIVEFDDLFDLNGNRFYND